MRFRALALATAVWLLISRVAGAQGGSFVGGDNVRLTAGQATPHGGIRNWNSGLSFGIAWESWENRGGGPGRVAAGIAGSYSRLPFSQSAFIQDFAATNGTQATRAEASDATMADLQVTLRVRGPALVIMPSVLLGVGYYNFHPAIITFQSRDTSGTAKMRVKSGPSGTLGLALDSPAIGRAAVFGEALYTYGWSSDSYLQTTAGAHCTTTTCDTFKSTQTTMLRAGLRVRLGRY